MSMIGTSLRGGSPSEIRMFLRADSAENLVRLQLQTNILLKGRASFTDFQFVKGKWYCWFLVDVAQHSKLLEQISGNTE